MKDFLGQELKVGDTVAFTIPKYQSFATAHIDHFGKQMVVLDVTTAFGCKVTPMSEATKYDKPLCRYPNDVIKVEGLV